MIDLKTIEALADADAYARLRLGIDLYPWQQNVLRAATARGARIAVRTCNESGKTSTLVTALVLWHMESFVGSLTITTSGSYRQVKDQLYPHLVNWAGRLGEGWEFGDGWGRHHRTGSRLVSFSTDNPGKAEGWHEPPRMPGDIAGRNNPLAGFGVDDQAWAEMAAKAGKSSLLLIIDEAKTPPVDIFEAFERCHATRWINLSSPGPSHGPFYNCFNRDAGRWECFKVAASDCPHLWDAPEKRAELEAQMRTLRPELVQSMIYGEFMPEGAGQVFDMGRVDESMRGGFETVGAGRYRRAALDISAGGDEQVLAACDGNRSWIEWAGFEKDDHRLVEIVAGRLRRLGIPPEDCLADDGGLGKIVINQFDREGFYLRRFDFGGDARGGGIYRNARAEAYFKLADLIRLGQAVIPADDLLREELAFARYEVDSSPLQLVAKRKLPRSPNRSDALVMVYYDLPEFGKLTEKEDDGADIVSPTRQRREREQYAGSVWDV